MERTYHVKIARTEYAYVIVDADSVVEQFAQVKSSAEKAKWLAAMREELRSLVIDNKSWSVPLTQPTRAKRLKTRWIFKKKIKTDGTVRYKARLVIKGFLQTFGLEYGNTYAPTARMTTLRLFLTLCARYKLVTRQMDVTTAFLNAPVEEEMYIDIPEGMLDADLDLDEKLFDLRAIRRMGCLRLLKAIYGLKQAPHTWNEVINSILTRDLGLYRSKYDLYLYVLSSGSGDDIQMILLLYVDDIIIGCDTKDRLINVMERLNGRFKMVDLGDIKTYLSINVE